jgi:phospholipid/cholesterol/gamma-HCH transport system substrate-binding protein
MRAKTDVAVGLFALGAFAILFWGTLRIGALRAYADADARTHEARFKDASGLSPESDVLIAGVRVGKVSAVELDGASAVVRLRITDRGARVPSDSTAAIRARGMLGERVLEIVPGEAADELPPGAAFARCEESADLGKLVAKLDLVAADVAQVSRAFRNTLGAGEGEESLRDIVGNVRAMTERLRGVVDANADRIDSIAANLDGFSGDLADLTTGQRDAVVELIGNLRTASAKLRESLDRLALVAARVEAGEGTLGKLVTDDSVYTEVDGALGEARAALREVRRAAEETQEQVPAAILFSIFGALF